VIALVAPLAIAMAVLLAVAVGEGAGGHPFGGLAPQNLGEAAGLGLAPDVIRFLGRGDDPRRVYAIRREVISSAVLKATALEASMWSRQLELVELLERQHALDDEGDRRGLACLARDLDIDDVVEHLAPGGVSYCEKGQAFARVLARTSKGTN
jgi:hypothetical protein